METHLFPLHALREALLNAVIHKNCSSGIPIQISVYEQQIVIWNPGQLPDAWTLELLLGKHPLHPFNPLLANAFSRAGYIESWGRGIEKLNRECREHAIDPPHFDYAMSGLILTFSANPKHLIAERGEKEVRRVQDATSIETPERILAMLATRPGTSLAEVTVAIGKSTRALERAVGCFAVMGKELQNLLLNT